MSHSVGVRVDVRGAAEVSVVITVPLTITISLGQPQISGYAPAPPTLTHDDANPPKFDMMKVHVGVNWQWGWYSFCYNCGCNRYMPLHRDGGPHGSWMAFCPVCRALNDAPHADNDIGRARWPMYLPTHILQEQERYPTSTLPPPERCFALKKG